MSEDVLCIAISTFAMVSSTIGTILFGAGNMQGRIGMKRIGIVVIAFAEIAAVLNLAWWFERS